MFMQRITGGSAARFLMLDGDWSNGKDIYHMQGRFRVAAVAVRAEFHDEKDDSLSLPLHALCTLFARSLQT